MPLAPVPAHSHWICFNVCVILVDTQINLIKIASSPNLSEVSGIVLFLCLKQRYAAGCDIVCAGLQCRVFFMYIQFAKEDWCKVGFIHHNLSSLKHFGHVYTNRENLRWWLLWEGWGWCMAIIKIQWSHISRCIIVFTVYYYYYVLQLNARLYENTAVHNKQKKFN